MRSCLGFGGCGGAALASGFGTGFLASSDLRAPAIGATLGGSGFFSIGFGSSLGLFSATGLGGSGFFSTGFSTGFGGGSGAVAVTISFFSVILPTLSSAGLASAIFSTSGLGLSFSPVLMPAVILESWSAEMISTGIDSGGGASSERAEKDTSPHPITRTWSATDAISVLSTFTFRLSLIHFRHQRHAPEAGGRQPSHHLHHGAVVDLLVAPNEDALIQPAARLGDRFQLRHQIINPDLGIVEEYLAFKVDRKRQRVLVLVEALGLGLRQIERHAHRQQRRRDHEDDQQHQHDVDHRGDVDLRHPRAPPAAASATAGR